ncbi:MAG: two-component system response regulator CreB [Opitutaceae bacterium]|jgi:two-component system catabolic regulation response regulator CreB
MSDSTRILLIEDETAIADTLVYALRTEGFTPEWRATGREGLEAFSTQGFALVILDVGLPDMSGFDLCRDLRTRTAVPVLFLTARNSEIDRVVGLELGGDDYVTKPFSPREVTARVRAILRRTQLTPATSAGVENSKPVCHLISDKLSDHIGLVIDAECKNAILGGVKLELTRYEFRLLAVLASRPGRVWSRDELMTQAWEDPGASMDRTVDAHIKTLRAKLRAVAPDEDPIQTHRGEGYSLRITP